VLEFPLNMGVNLRSWVMLGLMLGCVLGWAGAEEEDAEDFDYEEGMDYDDEDYEDDEDLDEEEDDMDYNYDDYDDDGGLDHEEL